MIGWLRIRIMCPSGATCLPTDCCLSELALETPVKSVDLVQNGHHYNLI